ncbi:MAG: hypothetical protein K1Y36_15670 [Blastocatellia bacterium]|nr:hypothetical protein [Blastocatellia bacterium]
MKKSLTFAMFGVGFILVAMLAIGRERFWFRQPLQVQAAHEPGARSVKWEYCLLQMPCASSTSFESSGRIEIDYLQDSGFQAEMLDVKIEKKMASQTAERLAFSKAITKLGDDGWELTIEGNLPGAYPEAKALLFKRPKR